MFLLVMKMTFKRRSKLLNSVESEVLQTGVKMYIQNGIVYAGELIEPIKVLAVRALNDYKLWLRFSDGEIKEFDFKPLLTETAFVPLQDNELFKSVYVDFGSAMWNDGEIDIAPEYLYHESISKTIET